MKMHGLGGLRFQTQVLIIFILLLLSKKLLRVIGLAGSLEPVDNDSLIQRYRELFEDRDACRFGMADLFDSQRTE